MGRYVNPSNEGFRDIARDGYVDKTGLIALVSGAINTSRKLVCSTRPRRFGKSFAAASLVAYYSCGCDSRALFEGLDISRDPSFERHLNAYNVVRLDMTAFRGAQSVAGEVTRVLLAELRELLPAAGMADAGHVGELTSAFADVVEATGRMFVFVIDEWDAPLRERRSKESQEDWVYFLRLLFKNATFTADSVAACYMTGILPIVRYGTQSALSDFDEFTFLQPGAYAPYVGFAEEEVEALAAAHDNGCAPAFYNNEQALRAVVRSAYVAAADHYAEVQGLPSGRGVADIVYLPKRGDPAPALVVELKWDRTPAAALAQIRDRDYPAVLRAWDGPLLLVGVTYDRKTKAHSCVIEEA